jgi:Mn-dependent DtxR family transcriptional regulator
VKIQEAAENYLETIYILKNKFGRVRSIDICKKLNYSKPTVSVMMKQFRENGYIEMDSDGYIVLTNKGIKIAETMYERHNVIAHVLMSIGVDEETAFADSCKMEHDISEKSFNCMKKHYLNQIK